jgi:hypothetical protein
MLTLLPRRSRYLADKMWASFGTTMDDDDEDGDAASSDTSTDDEDDSISASATAFASATATGGSRCRDDLPIVLLLLLLLLLLFTVVLWCQKVACSVGGSQVNTQNATINSHNERLAAQLASTTTTTTKTKTRWENRIPSQTQWMLARSNIPVAILLAHDVESCLQEGTNFDLARLT